MQQMAIWKLQTDIYAKIYSGGIFRHILNSSEKVFYAYNTKFSYTACQWIGARAVIIGKYIHHKLYGHGGERRVKG